MDDVQVYRFTGDTKPDQVLNEAGEVVGSLPDNAADLALEWYPFMIFCRKFDERAQLLQRQGRLGTYAPFRGQEAAQIASFAVLRPSDWVFPTYRELAGMMYHGLEPVHALLKSRGHPDSGRMPDGLRMAPVQIAIAAQILHAVGAGWACELQQTDDIAVAYFGDGATSEGDFHEGMNFAAVMRLPVVFFCQNNQYAISVPVERQTASPTIAQKAIAYGVEGIRVDGNDVFAVYQAMRYAVDRARRGEGPTLIEAVTYRLGPHTTADDPGRYREAADVERWAAAKDPLVRLRLWLTRQGLWDDARQAACEEEAEARVRQAVAEMEAYPHKPLAEAARHVYAEVPEGLALDLAERGKEAR
ncbi:pyruvate dehydrogenase (acetyl-transferring) E1 component, alpha subunit [Alicyclobacillus acidocaldarius subsp. acidocaldarius Tc-4-1]|uniref:Pyruvate dehydrogenase E1 component subunit alpha n=1 Tax=Alicyclobacillus acidocaldarius (strain Tc-4-1) TaxID=1048834 RepID=F8IFG3_ALIAT|nr:pyruvate dehydrogenase (acetyl-transferring) E1 component subunit alpha [Alicyclobacillus acidocaldarius]AEJ42865.1 pyruvate dehydrogenase (acetyl-transferring) E1 component, alpha subunit [Alicyclobacillus acidocaldarius subsp. acidocaldarius Tc-4-1]